MLLSCHANIRWTIFFLYVTSKSNKHKEILVGISEFKQHCVTFSFKVHNLQCNIICMVFLIFCNDTSWIRAIKKIPFMTSSFNDTWHIYCHEDVTPISEYFRDSILSPFLLDKH